MYMYTYDVRFSYRFRNIYYISMLVSGQYRLKNNNNRIRNIRKDRNIIHEKIEIPR